MWNHYKKQRIDGVDKAICNYCGKKLDGESKNGTKHLHDNFNRCPFRKRRNIKQAILILEKKLVESCRLVHIPLIKKMLGRILQI